MKLSEKYHELKSFLLYHCNNNPKRTLGDIRPLLNELLRRIDEPQIKENHDATKK